MSTPEQFWRNAYGRPFTAKNAGGATNPELELRRTVDKTIEETHPEWSRIPSPNFHWFYAKGIFSAVGLTDIMRVAKHSGDAIGERASPPSPEDLQREYFKSSEQIRYRLSDALGAQHKSNDTFRHVYRALMAVRNSERPDARCFAVHTFKRVFGVLMGENHDLIIAQRRVSEVLSTGDEDGGITMAPRPELKILMDIQDHRDDPTKANSQVKSRAKLAGANIQKMDVNPYFDPVVDISRSFREMLEDLHIYHPAVFALEKRSLDEFV